MQTELLEAGRVVAAAAVQYQHDRQAACARSAGRQGERPTDVEMTGRGHERARLDGADRAGRRRRVDVAGADKLGKPDAAVQRGRRA